MKFIGAGMSRRVFSLGNGHCVKKPIEGRLQAGIIQNIQEYMNTKVSLDEGYDIFPKIYSHNEDYSEIEVEECTRITYDQMEKLIGRLFPNRDQSFGIFALFAFSVGRLCKIIENAGSKIDDYEDFHNALLEIKSCLKTSQTMITPIGKELNVLDSTTFLLNIMDDSNRQYDIFRNIIGFYCKHPNDFIVEDLWNSTQWGTDSNGELKVIDAGWSVNVRESKYYNINTAISREYTKDGFESDSFNGQSVHEIISPKGNRIDYMFKTEKESEYILSSNNEARRIKQTGLKDDGLHSWTDKLMFMDYDDLLCAMNCINAEMKNMRPVRVRSNWKDNMILQRIGNDGEWENFYNSNSLSSIPLEGKNVIEFHFVEDNIIRAYHPGHSVKILKKCR